MNIRPALASDAELIARLHAESWRQTYRGMYPDEFLDGDVVPNRLAVWKDRLREERADQGVFVAEDQGSLLGFVCAYGNADARWGSLIDNLHVRPDRKGGGIGTQLIRAVAAWLGVRHGNSGVFLWVLEANAPARGFYERLGAFHAETVVMETPGGGVARSCRYVWSIPRALATAE